MRIRCRPSADQLVANCTLRVPTLALRRSTVVTATPSIHTRTRPRVGPVRATHATLRPSKLSDALAPAAVVQRAAPPIHAVLAWFDHVPDQRT